MFVMKSRVLALVVSFVSFLIFGYCLLQVFFVVPKLERLYADFGYQGSSIPNFLFTRAVLYLLLLVSFLGMFSSAVLFRSASQSRVVFWFACGLVVLYLGGFALLFLALPFNLSSNLPL